LGTLGALASHPDFDDYLINGKARRSKAAGVRLRWNVDTRGHGTHIAGTVSAKLNNNYGVRGMGSIPTYITRGLDENGNARESDIMEAIDQCVAANVKVISLSLTGSSMSNVFKTQIDNIYSRIMVVAAAGNEGQYYQGFPASYSKVVSVGAVDEGENIWSKSNYGPWLELTAPGVMVLSLGLMRDGQYQFAFYTGTSMATPHIAAAAALLWSYFPECSTTQIRYAMAKTAKDKGSRGCDNYYGYGIVQVMNAYNFLKANTCRNARWGLFEGSGQCSL
jgi:serine protease